MRRREQDKVREALFDDPTVDNQTFGRLVEEAAEADDRRSWAAEVPDDYEGPTGVAGFRSGRYR